MGLGPKWYIAKLSLWQMCLKAVSYTHLDVYKRQAYTLPSFFSGESRKQKFNVTLFSQELLALLESGLSLIESIEALAEKEQQAHAQMVFKQITKALYEGLPLSQALEQAAQVFTPCLLYTSRCV